MTLKFPLSLTIIIIRSETMAFDLHVMHNPKNTLTDKNIAVSS